MYSIQNSLLTASFHSKGAELIALENTKTGINYIWNGNPEFWAKHSPILFPIVGSLKNDSFTYKEKVYSLSRHGFARDMEFRIKESSASFIVFELDANENTLVNYPFNFKLSISYHLFANKLEVQYFLENYDNKTMPFAIGAHPAFSLLNDFENYSLQFLDDTSLNCFPLKENLLSDTSHAIKLKENLLPLNYKLFEKDALVIKELKSNSVTLFENQNPYLKVEWKNFKNLGIWTKTNAPFLCIEPWLGYSDTENSNSNILEKEGIHFLESQENFRAFMIISTF